MMWKPIASATEKNDTVFDGSMEETVEKLHIIRENFRKAYKKISTEELLDSVVAGVKEAEAFGEKIVNHFMEHGTKYGLGAISLLGLLVSFIGFLKMREPSSAIGQGKLNEENL